MRVEHVDFVSFLTEDLPRAKHFYSEVLGLEIETEGESDMEFRSSPPASTRAPMRKGAAAPRAAAEWYTTPPPHPRFSGGKRFAM